MAKFDIAQAVTNKIIDLIESGQVTGKGWQAPWNKGMALPRNAKTGKFYRGVNVLLLWNAGAYKSNVWATWKQWKSMGHQPENAKGQGRMIVFWKIIEKKERQPDGSEKVIDKVPFLRYSTVFNADLVPTYEEPDQNALDEAERFSNVDSVIESTGANIYHDGGHMAFYRPLTDSIHLPVFKSFDSASGYYSTALHELAHWTGHESRLKRDFSSRFGDNAYAFEELIAELSAAFSCAQLGITAETRQDHAEYIKHWLDVMKGDKNAIITASSQAAKATEYIIEASDSEASKDAA